MTREFLENIAGQLRDLANDLDRKARLESGAGVRSWQDERTDVITTATVIVECKECGEPATLRCHKCGAYSFGRVDSKETAREQRARLGFTPLTPEQEAANLAEATPSALPEPQGADQKCATCGHEVTSHVVNDECHVCDCLHYVAPGETHQAGISRAPAPAPRPTSEDQGSTKRPPAEPT